ncbi:MAG: glucosaminidase domain-containing protein [Puia sp.]|nr:glucosaminidase domain-containing protein [Puia sp.]
MNMKIVAFLMVLMAGKTLNAQNSIDVINYVNAYKDLAISEMQRSGIPASVILAQGIHETQAGTSELVKRSNNHFGIKCKDSWTGSVVYHDDDSKGECFRSYGTPLDSYKDHSDFLRNSQRYAFLFKLDPTDFEGWAYGLKKAGYATNIHYPQILIKLIKDYNLQQYSLIAMGRLKPSEEVVLTAPGMSSTASAPVASRQAAGGNSPVAMSSPFRAEQFPTGEFLINRTRVLFVKSGMSLLSVADQFGIPLSRLLEFNDLEQQDVSVKDQLLFLQRKRKTGSIAFHIVSDGETLYDISQLEGVRYDNLLEMNHLSKGLEPAAKERIYLQGYAPSRPLLAVGNNQGNRSDSTGIKSAQELIIYKN